MDGVGGPGTVFILVLCLNNKKLPNNYDNQNTCLTIGKKYQVFCGFEKIREIYLKLSSQLEI